MPSDPSDVELMLAVRRGDKNAFRALVERHKTSVINVIFRAIGDRWEAEDIAQRVFIQVYHSAQHYKPSAKFTTWLYTIVRNSTLNEIRRRHRHRAESLDNIQNGTDETQGKTLADQRTTNPADETLENELEQKIRAAIQSLPEEQRTAIILLRYEELSYEEIAKVLRRSVGATKSLIHRARESLKQQLKPYLEGK
jgi:RNA polymerase sigma-70 factor (ECF subfamily)